MKVEDFIISKRTINSLKKAGFNELSDFEGKTKQELKEIKGVGGKAYLELLEWLKINGKQPKFAPKAKVGSRHPKEARELVIKHLRGQNINYGNEMKIAAGLIEKWGVEATFAAVEALAPPNFYSLKYFCGMWFEKAVQKFLPVQIILEEKKPIEKQESEEIQLENYKPLEDKPMSFESFLKIRL